MDQDLHHELRPKRVERHRDEAKRLLRAHRAGDPNAVERAGERERFVLADALHVIAREHGYRSWPAFKHALEAEGSTRTVGRIGAAPSDTYADWAERLLAAAERGEADALARLRAHVPRLSDGGEPTRDDARVCLAREYGFRTWAELAEAADRAHETHYSRLPLDSPWRRAEAAIGAGDSQELQRLLDAHPGLELEDPGGTLLGAAAQPEAGRVPREVVDVLIEAGSELDVPLNLAACFNKADLVGWLLDAGADPAATHIWGITPLQTAAYHGAREAADVLVARSGLLPDALYIAAAAGDLERLGAWLDGEWTGTMRPNLADVGWPPQPPPSADPADILAEALALAAHAGRTEACALLIRHGADPARAPLYDITPLEWARRGGRTDATLLRLLGVR